MAAAAAPSCKFCACSELRACRLVEVNPPGQDPYLLPASAIAAIAVIPADAETRIVPCAWLLPDVCSNPECVAKAYAEARPLAETIDLALRLGLMEEAA
jgi:hypothetical protein